MTVRPNAALAQIHTQIMWSRLIAVVEEQAQTMLRTAFSTSVREAGDLSAGVFDRHGRMLAQAVTGTPGHINSMARCIMHVLNEYPAETLEPGDVIASGTVPTCTLIEHFDATDPASEDFPGWLAPGDVVELVVEGLGATRQRVVPGVDPHPMLTRPRVP